MSSSALKDEIMNMADQLAQPLWPTEWELLVRNAFDDVTNKPDWLLNIHHNAPILRGILLLLFEQDELGKRRILSNLESVALETQFHLGYLLVAQWVLCRAGFGALPDHFSIPRSFLDEPETFLLWFLRWQTQIHPKVPADWGHLVVCPGTLQTQQDLLWQPSSEGHRE